MREVYADLLEGGGYAATAQYIRLELAGKVDTATSPLVGRVVSITQPE